MATLALRVNGTARRVEVDDPDTPLLYVLRNDLDLTGTRVRVRARAVRGLHGAGRRPRDPIVNTAVSAWGPGDTTIEGLGSPEQPDPCRRRSSPSGRAVRLLHGGHRHDGPRAARQNPRPSEARCGRRSPATSAAAAATCG